MVNRVVQETEKFLKVYGIRQYMNLLLVLRELLIIAIVGNDENETDNLIKCRISNCSGARFKIEIEDQGGGFEYGMLDRSIVNTRVPVKNKGYLLVSMLSDDIEVTPALNKVTVYVTCG
ncbi:MAG: ATP-binding protein [Spirochaetales bacterium]|nr:ATP-binding protein [Spirochaetales bacterium]